MKLVALVAAGLLVPATAFALSTSPAKPTTISLSGVNGVPKCTKLPFVTAAAVAFRVVIHIDGFRTYVLRNVRAGQHSVKWCANPNLPQHHNVKNLYSWNVKTVHHKGDRPSPTTRTRFFHVIP